MSLMKRTLLLLLLVVITELVTSTEAEEPEPEPDPEHDHPEKRNELKRPRWLPKISDRLLELLDIRRDDVDGTYALPKLPFEYSALEPFMLERTVRIHHTGHHAAYTSRMNSVIAHMSTDVGRNPLQHLMHLDDLIDEFRYLFRNQGGGFVNHAFTFYVLGSVDQTQDEADLGPKGKVLELIEDTFGTPDILIERLSSTATQVFGSGYVWLCLANKASSRRLHIVHTANQDSPLSDGYRPILGIDLWEHAYYLQYQNKRTEYITTWWQLVNWDRVNRLVDAWIETEGSSDDFGDGSLADAAGDANGPDSDVTREEL